ncbi:MAG: LabA-like NYN domain-containing protein [Gammaproteobacteria bacterium]
MANKKVTDFLEEQRRIALFVDVQNIYYTVRDSYRRMFDYQKLWQAMLQRGEIVHAAAYAIDRDDPNQRKFQHKLREIGFEVKLKPYIQRADGSSKGDWDVGITIDVLEESSNADIVVLATGDGDFAPLAERIKEKFGVEIWVVSVSSLTAKTLIDVADQHFPIDGEMLINR